MPNLIFDNVCDNYIKTLFRLGGKIHISSSTYEILSETANFEIHFRGIIDIKVIIILQVLIHCHLSLL